MTQTPSIDLQWLFPEVDIDALDIHKHQDFLLTRILERGRLVDVQWALKTYGDSEILAFFRRCRSNELTARTKSFWRAYFDAEGEEWASPPSFRQNNVTGWPS
jgi:hypothetical protein